jgi:cyclic beta-1,2-glucan synthetase
VTAFYLDTTGDHAVLDESVRFLQADLLEEGEDEVFLEPRDSGERGSLYEHCCRALDRSLTQGVHGLPLMGTGDWNDGMNRVGRQGRGESVWLGFFLYCILHNFIPLCEARDDHERAACYAAYRQHLAEALNEAGWDGNWYRRAYYDNGAPLGSAQSDECRIDALAQAWAVISDAAPSDRADQALDAMVKHLVSEEEGLIRLLTPAFDETPHDPGYIKGYVPGVRENGGQYTHAALWAVKALAEAGRNERAARLMQMLSPVSHGRTPEEVAVYQVEPYVIAADVYGVAPHVGRGGWTWYTGSAGWMYRVVLESILGFHLEGGATLVLCPHIPDAWPGFRIRYRLPGSTTAYDIDVQNPDADAESILAVEVDGEVLPASGGEARIPMVHDGAMHRVVVRMGACVSVAAKE